MCKAAVKLFACVALCGALASIALADEADDQFAMAASHYSAKRWNMAIDSFRKFLHDYPENAKHCKALFFEAESLVQLGRHAEAAPLFLDAMAEEPSGPYARQSLFRVAEAAVKCGKTDEAQLRLFQFQSTYPNDNLNASVLLYRGDLALRAAMPLRPNNVSGNRWIDSATCRPPMNVASVWSNRWKLKSRPTSARHCCAKSRSMITAPGLNWRFCNWPVANWPLTSPKERWNCSSRSRNVFLTARCFHRRTWAVAMPCTSWAVTTMRRSSSTT